MGKAACYSRHECPCRHGASQPKQGSATVSGITRRGVGGFFRGWSLETRKLPLMMLSTRQSTQFFFPSALHLARIKGGGISGEQNKKPELVVLIFLLLPFDCPLACYALFSLDSFFPPQFSFSPIYVCVSSLLSLCKIFQLRDGWDYKIGLPHGTHGYDCFPAFSPACVTHVMPACSCVRILF